MKVFISKDIVSEEAQKLAEQLKEVRAEVVELEKRLRKERRAIGSDAVLLASAKKNLALVKGKSPGREAIFRDQIKRAQQAIDKFNSKHKPIIAELESTLSKLREESAKLEQSLEDYYTIDADVVK